MPGARGTLIAFSQQPSVAEFMKRILEEAGYNTIACWSTVDDLERIVDENDPGAVVYEVGLPFASELNRFQDICRRPALAHKPFVIATPAPQALCHRFGLTGTLDIFTRPTTREVEAALDHSWRVQQREIRGAPPAAEHEAAIADDHTASIARG
jgi:DNA-binding response OmpR family regulator